MQLAARIGTMARSGAPLPYDAEVEYIENNNTESFIDTKIFPSLDFRVDAKMRMTSVRYGGVLLGGRSPANGSGRFFVYAFNGTYNTRFSLGDNEVFIENSGDIGLDHVFVFNDPSHNVYIDGELKGRDSSPAFSETYTILMFATSSYGGTYGANYFANGRIYYAKFTNNVSGVVLADFYPVRFTNDNGVSEGAMYDRVSGQLFRNKGTGAFVIGPDKVGTELAGGYKCVRRSWRSASRRSRHFSRWGVAA